MRLDRFLSNFPDFSRLDARLLLAAGRIRVDGRPVLDGRFEIREFHRVELDERLLQAGKPARYFMLYKPSSHVSATEHPEHPTVLDLLDEPDKHELHLGGRLDLTTTGLLLITNDGHWSRRLTLPGSKQPKVYHVETEQPIGTEYVETFARGLYFAFEDLTTLPAQLEILDTHSARLTLHEGRYHQVKRMFGHFRNRVVRLHRESIGPLKLDPHMTPGDYRSLTEAEVACF
ncbi:pseudouridine synthase [Metapseudomonas resinovorans]|uniref:Pseudouridine synthase n=1 Tax=Metapseudomonas resinovorans NBRC 106553 TaxID=1245471 RepID=S6AT08_METRE|nr:pseudouridine synthase [Pseudomonas resinovorans]BAN47271.1 ribosomal small subunit pseudouridine synthase A [Pseudomonas resinovorans NBRC 106553]